ncbi:MAG: anti-sigma factor [Cyanobacteria bacterium J069]|nr:MAG: anti-sigma factor [Cyanobacteria bacterium J069]
MTQSLSDEAKELAAGYVLGELDPEEERQLQQLLRQNPALTQEVQALSAVFRLLPHALPPVEPPAELRDRILAANAESEAAPLAAVNAPLPLDMLRERRSAARWSRAGRSPSIPRWQTLTAIAAGFAILALGLDNLRLRQQVAEGEGLNSEAIATILQQPNSRLVGLTDSNATAAGTVLFTPGRWDEVVVSMENLPALPPDQTYRMWLRLQDGTLILCGEFVPDSQGTVFAKLTPPQQPTPDNKAASVFITVESQGAPAEPQGSPVVATEL